MADGDDDYTEPEVDLWPPLSSLPAAGGTHAQDDMP